MSSSRRALATAVIVLLAATFTVWARSGDDDSADRPGDRFGALPAATLVASGRGVETDARITALAQPLTRRPTVDQHRRTPSR